MFAQLFETATAQRYQPPPHRPDGTFKRQADANQLFNDQTFYRAFLRDLRSAKREVVICSPFITKYRSAFFQRTFRELQRRNVAVFIFTRATTDQEYGRRFEPRSALKDLEAAGAYVIQVQGAVHEKVAIIDRSILWEGSLNILSQRESREMMRRTENPTSASEVMAYLRLNGKIADGYRLQYERLCKGLVERVNRSTAQRRFAWALGVIGLAISWLVAHRIGTIGVLSAVWNAVRLLNAPLR